MTTAIDDADGTASLGLAFKVAEYFGVEDGDAKGIVAEVGQAVAKWRSEAAGLGLASKEINRMASAFEHKDLEAALRFIP